MHAGGLILGFVALQIDPSSVSFIGTPVGVVYRYRHVPQSWPSCTGSPSSCFLLEGAYSLTHKVLLEQRLNTSPSH